MLHGIEMKDTKNNNKKKIVAVTGGAGFIGSHLADKLLEMGYKVRVIDNLCIFKRPKDFFYKNPKVEYFKCDIRNLNSLLKPLKDVDAVFHLAALARIQPSIKNPRLYEEVNSLGTLNVLLAAKKAGVRRVIYSSSSSVYGLKNKPPVKEAMPPDPLNPYASTKLAGEYHCRIFSSLFGLETVIFRYFNVYGPRQPDVGFYTPVVARFLEQLKRKKLMTIIGSGRQTRSFTYIDDVVRANILAMKSKKVGKGEIINISTGPNTSYSINQLAEIVGNNTIQNLLKNKKAVYVPARPAEIPHSSADISQAKKILGWTTKISLKQGIENMKKVGDNFG